MEKKKNIIIVGGGISGLTAGIYAEKCGFHATIFEKNHNIGGLCNGWYRQGRYVDGCIHWLTGTKKDDVIRNMWEDVGGIDDDNDIIEINSFGSIVHKGVKVTFYSDINKTEKEWLEISPSDKKIIKRFFRYARNIASMELPLDCPISLMGFKDLLKTGFKMIPHLWTLFITTRYSKKSFSLKFKNESLRYALHHAQAGENNLFTFLYSYGTVCNKNAGIPIGGSLPFVNKIYHRFLDLGGNINLNAEIDEIVVEDEIAKGVKLKNGTIYYADYVVASCDSLFAVSKLLRNQYDNVFYKMKLNDRKFPTPSCLHFSFIYPYELYKNTETLTFEIKPLLVGNSIIRHITFRPFSFDKKTYLGDDGYMQGSVLIDQYGNDFSYWDALRKEDIRAYQDAKINLANEVINRIEQIIPSLKGKINLLDSFSPATLNRYCNATEGAYMPFMYTKKGKMLFHNAQIGGVKNFFLASQWIQSPGGLPLALASGKFAIQRICKKEHIYFINKKPKKIRYS